MKYMQEDAHFTDSKEGRGRCFRPHHIDAGSIDNSEWEWAIR
jgi:hypothetical protein